MNIIAKRRHELGLTLDQLADILGVNRSAVWAWENGITRLSKKSAIRVHEVLGIPLEELKLDLRVKNSDGSSWLSRKRIELNLTQNDLAVLVGIDKSTISLYESGKRPLPQKYELKYANVLGVTMAEFRANVRVNKPPERTYQTSKISTPTLPAGVEPANPPTCLDPCKCSRWYCIVCKTWWTGVPIHECNENDGSL